MSIDDDGENLMRWLPRAAYVALWAVSWSLVYRSFLRAEATIEPRLFGSGRHEDWWLVVLLYWVVDTVLVIGLAHSISKGFRRSNPERLPFWQYAIDVAVLVFLVHLAWVCTDRYLYFALDSVGLSKSSFFLCGLVLAWLGVLAVKYRPGQRTLPEAPNINESV